MDYEFSFKVNSMHAEDVKLLMQQSSGKKMISFAGGMPNNDLFPVSQIDEIYNKLAPPLKKLAFQYGPTSGLPLLVNTVTNLLESKDLPVSGNKLLITTGSLQALSIVTQVFVDPGDIILTEYPCFVGALTVFETYGADIRSIPVDDEGIRIDKLKETLENLEQKPKFLYVTPNFHNPAGLIYSQKRKMELLEVLEKYGVLLLEDDAYNDLYFDDKDRLLTKPMKAMKTGVEIIYTGSFSKILGPGFRLGYMLASPEISEKAENIKQALDACTSNLTQILAAEFTEKGYLVPYLQFLRKEYYGRKELMIKALEKYMPEPVSWNNPKGGFYIWVDLPEHIRSTELFNKCVDQGVVFVTGRTFDPEGVKDNCFRLSFANVPRDEMEKGIEKLAAVIKNLL